MIPEVSASINRVRDRVAAAAQRSGRRPEDVALVAASKGIDVDRIKAAIASGVEHVGENRVQEAAPKISAVGRDRVRWHMIGHLQRNKARQALDLFDVIESVDSVPLAADLSKRTSRPIEILLQVNVSGERQKYGFSPDDLVSVIDEVAALPRLNLTGLMTIAPMTGDPETVRPVFRRLRELRDRVDALDIPGLRLRHLSMGMSDDFEVAIEEGATIVRIGRAIFGKRDQ